MLLKKVFLKILQISQETPVFESLFNKVAGLQVVSCAFCEIFKYTFFYRTPPVAASHMILLWIKSEESFKSFQIQIPNYTSNIKWIQVN